MSYAFKGYAGLFGRIIKSGTPLIFINLKETKLFLDLGGNYRTNGTFGTVLAEKPPPYPTSAPPPPPTTSITQSGKKMQYHRVHE